MPKFLYYYYLFSFFRCFGPINGLYAILMLSSGLSPWQVSSAFLASGGIALALEIPSGTLADRLSYRKALVLSQTIRIVAYALLLISPGYTGFLIAMILLGAKETLISGTNESLLFTGLRADESEGDYGKFLGYETALNRLALLVSAVIGGVLFTYGLEFLLWATILPSLFAAVAAIGLPVSPRASRLRKHSTLTMIRLGFREVARKPLLLWMILVLGFVFGFDLWNYWVIFSKEAGLSKATLGYTMVGVNVAGMLAGILAARFQKLSIDRLLMISAAGSITLLGASLLAQQIALIGAFLFLVLHYAVPVALQGRMQSMLSDSTRATVTSIPAFLGAFFCLCLDLLFGAISTTLSYHAFFVMAATLLVLLVVVAWISYGQVLSAVAER